MLPDIRLDTENFSDIMENARGMIASVYPEWTDYNLHDPGITLLELFALMKEVQQFHLDQIGTEHQRKIAKLLGASPEPAVPAKLMLEFQSGEAVQLRQGERFFCGGLSFETQRAEWLPGGGIRFCRAVSGGRERETAQLGKDELLLSGKFRFYPFGRNAQAGAIFEMELERPLCGGRDVSLCFGVCDDYPVPLKPLQNPLPYPPARFRLEYRPAGEKVSAEAAKKTAWRRADIVTDGTCGFLQSGQLRFSVPAGDCASSIRLVLEQADYDVPPVLTAVCAGCVELVQRETKVAAELGEPLSDGSFAAAHALAEHGEAEAYLVGADGLYRPVPVKKVTAVGSEDEKTVFRTETALPSGAALLFSFREADFPAGKRLGIGTGFPNQRFETGVQGIEAGSTALLAEDVLEPGSFRLWSEVPDFDGSGPEDLHFRVEAESGAILFGDGYHGMAPEGELRLLSLSVTAGQVGNIKPGAVSRQNSDVFCSCFENRGGTGGRDAEPLSEVFRRIEAGLRCGSRAVSKEDYCRHILEAPGLRIQSCCVMPAAKTDRAGTVSIVVRPYSPDGRGQLRKSCRRNLLAYLEPRRMLGTELLLRSPEYIELSVYAEVFAQRGSLHADRLAEEAVRVFFAKREGAFGVPLIRGQLYGAIDSLEAVEGVAVLSLEAWGGRTERNAGGDLFPSPCGIFLLKEVVCRQLNA